MMPESQGLPTPETAASAAATAQASLAALFVGAGCPLEVRSLPLPQLEADEALVRIDFSTICGSDLHTITGKRIEPAPSILGHEMLGTVAAVGNPPPSMLTGKPVQIGNRITWGVGTSCGTCSRCLQGLPQKCLQLFKYGHSLAAGRDALTGGLAEYVLVKSGSAILPVDPTLPDAVASPANCATATVAAAFRVAGSVAQRRLLIFGAGMLGLTAAAFAKWSQAAHITLCDIDPQRLELGQQFGADHTQLWLADRPALQAQLKEQTGSAEFDLLLEFSGAADAVEACCEFAAIGASIVLVGTVMKSRPIQLDPEQFVRRWISMHGVHNYAPCDLRTALDFLLATHQLFPFAALVERTYTLEQINQAVEDALQNRPVRVGIRSTPNSL